LALALAVLGGGMASASTTVGRVTFVGTISEKSHDGAYSARLRVRVTGTWDTDSVAADRWVVIRSSRTEAITAHDSLNMKNAYRMLMAALLADKTVQIDKLPDCSATSPIFMDLWTGTVSLF
jgi:hypothetical protein